MMPVAIERITNVTQFVLVNILTIQFILYSISLGHSLDETYHSFTFLEADQALYITHIHSFRGWLSVVNKITFMGI